MKDKELRQALANLGYISSANNLLSGGEAREFFDERYGLVKRIGQLEWTVKALLARQGLHIQKHEEEWVIEPIKKAKGGPNG